MSPSKKRNDVTMEIVVGAFMFTILVVLLTVTVVISQNKFFEKSYRVQATFPDVGGLKEGEGVYWRGVKIGNVEKIAIDEQSNRVRTHLRLTRMVPLHEDYELFVEPSSMLGGMRLIVEQGSDHLPLVPESALQDLRGSPTKDFLAEATKTIAMIRSSIEEAGTLDHINRIAANLSDITGHISAGEGTVGRLIRDETLYDNALALVKDFSATGANLRVISDRLAAGEGSLGRLLSADDSVYRDLSGALEEIRVASADARKILQRLEAGEGSLGKLLSSDDALYEDLRATIASLREFSGSLAQQEGTLGKLVTDPGLYLKVEALVDEARATIDDFRETSPITTFSTIFFGAF